MIQEAKEKNKQEINDKLSKVKEGTDDETTPLNSIYTPLYMTKGRKKTTENEIRQLEIEFGAQAASFTEIDCNDIFKPQDGGETTNCKRPRTVLTEGMLKKE